MTHELKRHRSARHYLTNTQSLTRLQITVALAARTVGFTVAMVNIVDEGTLYTITSLGVSEEIRTPREAALCDLVVRTGRPLAVEDTDADIRFENLPSIVGHRIGSYLGVPLIGRESLVVGALCVVDTEPRQIGAEQLTRLTEFARVVEDQLDLMRRLSVDRRGGSVPITELARAITDTEIVPWYQPIIDLATGDTIGFEALARWQHPNGALTDPHGFVPLAEDSDLILDIDQTVMRQAVKDMQRWQTSRPDWRISINLSGRNFDRSEYLSSISEAAASAGIPAASIDLELTEGTPLDAPNIAGQLSELRQAGFKVWLDDFGTGWSALDYLLRIQVDGIKIDRAMSVALGSPVGNAITRAVSTMAQELGLLTVIEGIETAKQATLAREFGCDRAQGFLWSAAIPARAIDDSLRSEFASLTA